MASAAAVAAPVASTSRTTLNSRTKPILTLTTTPTKSNFVIPTITITPPDTPSSYSMATPEQKYEKSVLFVPVRTEVLGWDEHGLYWNGTYAYPVHQIYDKEGGAIGRRRKGPAGYRFEEYYGVNGGEGRENVTRGEARVRLEEPAPARISSTPSTAARAEKISHSIEAELDAAEEKEVEEEEVEMLSPNSPTLSMASEEDSSTSSMFGGDDSSSIWSSSVNNDDDDDDEEELESACTSPGVMSPSIIAMDVDEGEAKGFAAEKLSAKLSTLSSPTPVTTPTLATKDTWLSLGTLPSSSASTAASTEQTTPSKVVGTRSNSLPATTPGVRRTSNNMLTSQHHEPRRHSTPSTAYSSIIQDLTTSPFASSSSSCAASGSGPFRSATLPRSSSSSCYGRRNDSILRQPPSSTGLGRRASTNSSSLFSSTRHSSSRSGGGVKALHHPASAAKGDAGEFSAGYNFESHSAALSTHWGESFADHY